MPEKVKYLIEKYKYPKSWNRNQSGGQIGKSVFYDKIDPILGTRDVVTLKKVAKAGSSTAPASRITPSPSPDGSNTQPSTSSRTATSSQLSVYMTVTARKKYKS